MLNTKQVRAVAKQAQLQYMHTYTDKTQTDKTSTRRSVVFKMCNATQADILANFLRSKIVNNVKRTTRKSNFATYTHGGEYVRVIANIA
jgi:hypothetical protein